MAYKKYIKRGGKVYGPYIYHSKRINGKVVSEYRGQEKTENNNFFARKNNIFILAGFFIFLISLIYFFGVFHKDFSGKVVLELDELDRDDGIFNGILKLSLEEVEKIPVSSKIVFENNGNKAEYLLIDLINEQEKQNLFGDNYFFDENLENKIYPTISFKLNIFSEKDIKENTSEKEISKKEDLEKQDNQEVLEKDNQEEKDNGDSFDEDNVIDEVIDEVIGEESKADNEEVVEQDKIQEEISKENNDEKSMNIGDFVANVFLSLSMTGKAIVDFEKEVFGEVSYNNPFFYNLDEGETAELDYNSIKTNSKKLSKDNIDFYIEDKEVKITTNYYEIETLREKKATINLFDLGMPFNEGILNIKLIDDEKEIVSFDFALKEFIDESFDKEKDDFIDDSKKEIDEKIHFPENKSIEEPIFEEILNDSIFSKSFSLDEKERKILINKFGSDSNVEVKKAIEKNNFIVLRYELGDFWVEHSYPSYLGEKTLNEFIERDRIKWLKDIVKSLERDFEEGLVLEDFFNFSYGI